MYRRKHTEDEWGFVADVLKIALGVFIGSMAAVFTYEGVLAWRVAQASQQVMQTLKEREDQSRLARQQRLRQEQEEQGKRNLLAQESERQRQQQVQAARKKEQAWLNFYQPSQTCRADPSRGDCADAHISA